MNTCKICNTQLSSARAKICNSSTCRSSWKMLRNASLPPVTKHCARCSAAFVSSDRRNNFCSYVCKCEASNKTKLDRYGTLSLESRESIERRRVKAIKIRRLCKVEGCSEYSRTKGMCAPHYVKLDYMKSEHGLEVYRLNNQKRRDRDVRILTVNELKFLRAMYPACMRCGTLENMTLDHHIPLSLGGKLSFLNTVLLCASCNSQKHNKLPENFYTIEELTKIESYFSELAAFKAKLPTVVFLFGCFGVGKTTVAGQLRDKFHVVEYDNHKNASTDVLDVLGNDKLKLYVSSVKVTPFINKFSMRYNIVPVAMLESYETVCERLRSRGGEPSDGLFRRFERINKIAAKYAAFSGSSAEVIKFLFDLTSTIST